MSSTIARPELLYTANTVPMVDTGRITYYQMSRLVAGLEAENARLHRANRALGSWLSAELRNEHASPEVKNIVNQWFKGVDNDAHK